MSSIIKEHNEENQILETSKKLQTDLQEIREFQNNISFENRLSNKHQPIQNLKFCGKKDPVNPKLFIENFEIFAAQEELDENNKQNWFIQSLVKYAAIWMEERGYGTYEEMKKAFLAFYWSQDVQKSYANHLEFGKYNKKCRLSMANYFYKYAIGAKFLDSAPSETEIISKLSKHFDPNIENEFLKQKVQNIEEAADMLKRIEALKWNIPVSRIQKNFMLSVISPEVKDKNSINSWAWAFLWLAGAAVALNFIGKVFYMKN